MCSGFWPELKIWNRCRGAVDRMAVSPYCQHASERGYCSRHSTSFDPICFHKMLQKFLIFLLFAPHLLAGVVVRYNILISLKSILLNSPHRDRIVIVIQLNTRNYYDIGHIGHLDSNSLMYRNMGTILQRRAKTMDFLKADTDEENARRGVRSLWDAAAWKRAKAQICGANLRGACDESQCHTCHIRILHRVPAPFLTSTAMGQRHRPSPNLALTSLLV